MSILSLASSVADALAALEQRPRPRRDVVRREAELLEDGSARSRGAEALDRDHVTAGCRPSAPSRARRRLDRERGRRQSGGSTSSRYDAGCASKSSQQGIETTRTARPSSASAVAASSATRHLGAGREQDEVRSGRCRPTPRARRRRARRRLRRRSDPRPASRTGTSWRDRMSATGPSARSSATFHAYRRLVRVGGPHHPEVRDRAQRRAGARPAGASARPRRARPSRASRPTRPAGS